MEKVTDVDNLRLRCIELAVESADGKGAVDIAMQYYNFVRGKHASGDVVPIKVYGQTKSPKPL